LNPPARAELTLREALARELAASLRARYDYQDTLDAVRGWVVERRADIARRWIGRKLTGRQAVVLQSALAETAIGALLPPTVTRLAATRGQLLHGRTQPDLQARSTRTALKRLRRQGLLDRAKVTTLIEALGFWHEVQGSLRLLAEIEDRDGPDPELLDAAVARATGLADAGARAKFTERVAASVRDCYARVLG